ncbi:hypothetical protein WDV76_07905 [Xenorhabdus griffiniae]|uniref:hypothetical protein n=1 Tax=Xenorhabdus griffiniae TaxID=351672 RepID=UPI0030CD8EFE
MMSWGNGFFAKTMIPDHHAVQIPLTKRQHALIKNQDNFSGDLLQKFQKYFEWLEHCIISAKGFYEDFGTYSPVKVIVTDIPYCITEIDRSLEEYDFLGANELPFWLRYEGNQPCKEEGS